MRQSYDIILFWPLKPEPVHALVLAGYGTASAHILGLFPSCFKQQNADFRCVQVWDTVETYDTGCTPGGGKNGISVFSDAGLLFASNTASATPHRQGGIQTLQQS